MTSVIGLGTASPEYSFSQEECLNHALKYAECDDREQLVLRRLYKKTLIENRGSCIAQKIDGQAVSTFFRSPTTESDCGPTTEDRMKQYAKHANELSLEASRRALADAAVADAAVADAPIAPEDITHLITVSCTGFDAPGFDLHLVRELGLSPGVFRTHVGFMGCHGTLNALRVADGFITANPKAKVLLCSTEICSIHFQYGKRRGDIVSNALFADGSAALVLAKRTGKFSYNDSKSLILPNSSDAMQWHVGDHGFTMNLSSDVPDLISRNLKSTLTDWLSTNSLQLADVKSWAIHPGGPRVLDTVERTLGLNVQSTTASHRVLQEHGNMSSATIVFILKELLNDQSPLPCVLLAFGPGLTVEAALLT